MKQLRFAISILICACLMCFTVSAARYTDESKGFSLDIPDEYVVIDENSVKENAEFISKLGSSAENFKKAMQEGNIVLYAATEDNQNQLQVKIFDSDTAKKIGELSGLSEDNFLTAAEEIAKLVVADGELLNAESIINNNTRFVHYTVRAAAGLESDTDQIGYCFDEYLTVVNGKFYALIYYNSSADFSDADASLSKSVFDSFYVESAANSKGLTPFEWVLRILIPILIASAILLGAWIVYSFISDFRYKQNQPESIPDHIKMRRK